MNKKINKLKGVKMNKINIKTIIVKIYLIFYGKN